MFNRIKNLAEDIQRNIDVNGRPSIEADETEINGGGNNSTTVENDQLSADIRAKLVKFAKYEAKYPQLLEAYKAEKARNDQLSQFEKILQENTPISSISEPEALVEYLNSLNMKNEMLNNELRRLNKDSKDHENSDARVKELETKISELETEIQSDRDTKIPRLATASAGESIELAKFMDSNSEPSDGVGDLTEHLQKITSNASSNESIQNELKLAKKEIEVLTKSSIQLKEEVNELAEANNSLISRLKDSERSKGEFEIEISEYQGKQENIISQREALENTIQCLSSEKNEISVCLDAAESSNEVLRNDIKKLQTESQDKIRDLQQQLEALNASGSIKEELAAKLDDMIASNKDLENQLEEKSVTITELRSQSDVIANKQAFISDLEGAIAMKDSEIDTLTKETTELRDSLTSATDSLSNLQTKTTALEKPNVITEVATTNGNPALDIPEPSSSKRKNKKKNKKGKATTGVISDCVKETHDTPIAESEADASAIEIKNLSSEYSVLGFETENNRKGKAEELEIKAEEAAKMKEELETLKSKHSQLMSAFDKYKAQSAKELQSKAEEVISVRDMLKEVGNDLVAARDDLKRLNPNQMVASETEKNLESYKGELEKLRDQHVNLLNRCEAEKSDHQKECSALIEEKERTSLELNNLKKEVDKLCEENENIVLSRSNEISELTQKVSDWETKLKELRVAHEAKIKDLDDMNILLEERTKKISELEASLEKVKSEYVAKASEFEKTKYTLEEEIVSLKSKASAYELEKARQEEQLAELSRLKRAETQLSKELSTTRANLLHREKTITYFEKQVKDYDLLKTQLLDEVTKFKASNRDLNIQTTTLTDQVSRLSREKAKLNDQWKDAIKQKKGIADENKALQDKIDSLQLKFESLNEMKSTNTGEVELLKRQCEELTSSNKEALKRIRELDEELNETHTLLQERTRESSTIRRLLIEKEQEQDSKFSELNRKLQNAIDCKDAIQSESDIFIAKTQREFNELKLKYSELEKLTTDWETRNAALSKEIQELNMNNLRLEKERKSSSTDSNEITNLLDKLRGSLNTSEKKVREYEQQNKVLKQLNEDLNSKIERLTKNYKMISNQLKESQSQTPPSVSSSPVPIRSSSIESNLNIDAGSKNETEIPYIRNVLLGFLEHREQREQLLPVVSMLLKLSKAEEHKLLVALK